MKSTEAVRSLVPVTEWHNRHPWPPIGGLRHLILHSKSNGFDGVVYRIGRRVLIDEAAFFDWVRSHSPQKKTNKVMHGGA